MGATWKLFLILALFCYAACAGYIIWGLTDQTFGGHIEWVGTVGLALVGALCPLITFYV